MQVNSRESNVLEISMQTDSTGCFKKVLGAAHHYVRSQEGLSSADIFRTRGSGGSSDADDRTFWSKKTSDFSKFMVCSHGCQSREIELMRSGEGSIFQRFCADVFYGRHLTTLNCSPEIYIHIFSSNHF